MIVENTKVIDLVYKAYEENIQAQLSRNEEIEIIPKDKHKFHNDLRYVICRHITGLPVIIFR